MPEEPLKHKGGRLHDSMAHQLGLAAQHHRLYVGTIDDLLMKAADQSAKRYAAIKEALIGLSLADHLGDVNDEIKTLCYEFDLPEPEWDENRNRYRFAWEVADDED